ncbi:response regulator [Sulfitobacter sp. R18_1]|uniref:response regulator transcription factor n=1 Tax=Sulfitobacter sp. R18_1 TaxID=2821104 RepID=UPI001ADCB43C|nr:response regulator [Sulfitobacter sp. R18_1]MBO9432364.1 response regulator [Sulfitobacter sp. R18_1]
MIKVLLVEDQPDILEITKISLELYDSFEVCECSSGEAALSKATEFNPEVLLLDYMMPDMSGLQTLEKLRKLPGLADVPAIFLTARVGEHAECEMLAAGAIEVITKPFRPRELGARIRAAIAR